MKATFRAGRLDRRVQLYDLPGETRDGYGQSFDAPSLIGTFWARVEHMKGRELQAAMQVYTKVTHRVTMRWLGSAIPATPDNPNGYILPRMTMILEDGRRLEVVDANKVDERRRTWVLMVDEKVLS